MTAICGEIARAIKEYTQEARDVLVSRVGVLRDQRSKYDGRRGVIDDVMPDGRYGLLASFYVFRSGTNLKLNSDGESRQYRALDTITLTGERFDAAGKLVRNQ